MNTMKPNEYMRLHGCIDSGIARNVPNGGVAMGLTSSEDGLLLLLFLWDILVLFICLFFSYMGIVYCIVFWASFTGAETLSWRSYSLPFFFFLVLFWDIASVGSYLWVFGFFCMERAGSWVVSGGWGRRFRVLSCGTREHSFPTV